MVKKIDFAYNVLNQVHDWIRFSDEKAGLILATDGVLLGFFTSQISSVKSTIIQIPNWSLLMIFYFLVVMIGLCLLLSIVFAFRVIYPQLNVGESKSLIYFGHIHTKSECDFVSEFLKADDDKLERDVLTQIYSCAKIAWQKYKNTCYSIRSLIAVIIFWGLSLLFPLMLPCSFS